MFSKVHGFPWKFNSEFGPPEKLPNTQKERKGSSSNHHFSGAKMLNFGGVTNKRRIPPWNCWFETVWKKVKQQVLDIQKTHFKNSLCCTLFKSHLPKTFSLNFRKTFSCIYCTYIYIYSIIIQLRSRLTFELCMPRWHFFWAHLFKWAMKQPWLVRLYRGLYYPVI